MLVVDLGSSGVKASVWEDGGRLVCASSTRKFDRLHPAEAFACMESAVDEALMRCAGEIVQVGFASFGMSLVGLDAEGEVAAYATYQGHLFGALAANLDTSEAPKETGAPVPHHPAYARFHMQHWDQHRLGVHRYSTFVSAWLEKITASRTPLPISLSEASWWGLLEWRQMRWALTDPRLPQVCDYDEAAVPGLSPEFAKRWPKLVGARFNLAVVDGAAATLASGPLGSCVVTVATSAAVRVIRSAGAVFPIPNGCFVHVLDRDRVVVGGGLTDGGSAWDLANTWFPPASGEEAALWQRLNQGKLDELPICLPFFSGERAPGWAGKRIPASLLGLTPHTTGAEMKLAVVLGVGMRLGEIHELLLPLLTTASEAYISGSGLVNSPVWRAVVSSALGGLDLFQGKTQLVQARDDTTARGVALLLANAQVSRHECRLVTERRREEEVQVLARQRALQRRYYKSLL